MLFFCSYSYVYNHTDNYYYIVRVSDCGGTITAGQNCSLKCTLTGVESQNPTITYKWLKYNGTQQVEVGTGSNILSFPSLNLSDAGQYTCQVTVDSQMYGYTEYIHIQSQLELVNYM